MAEWDAKTEKYTRARTWTDPVRRREDLPDVANEGTFVYVEAESSVYAFRGGSWIRVIVRRPD